MRLGHVLTPAGKIAMQDAYYTVPTSPSDVNEMPRAGSVLQKDLSSSPVKNFRPPAAQESPPRTTPRINTVGCLCGLRAMLGSCFLAGPLGLAITAIVVIRVSRDFRPCACG